MVNFSASEKRFFAQVREIGSEYLREFPDTSKAEFEKLIPSFMRKALDRQVYVSAQFKGNPALALELAKEVFTEINAEVIAQ